jgi:hypothetical protein
MNIVSEHPSLRFLDLTLSKIGYATTQENLEEFIKMIINKG